MNHKKLWPDGHGQELIFLYYFFIHQVLLILLVRTIIPFIITFWLLFFYVHRQAGINKISYQ